jgi:hypothetical protein
MIYNATKLRKDIYSVLDSVLDSGIPVEIERNGRRLRIVPDEPSGRLNRLEPHQIVNGDSYDLADQHWDESWTGRNLG